MAVAVATVVVVTVVETVLVGVAVLLTTGVVVVRSVLRTVEVSGASHFTAVTVSAGRVTVTVVVAMRVSVAVTVTVRTELDGKTCWQAWQISGLRKPCKDVGTESRPWTKTSGSAATAPDRPRRAGGGPKVVVEVVSVEMVCVVAAVEKTGGAVTVVRDT